MPGTKLETDDIKTVSLLKAWDPHVLRKIIENKLHLFLEGWKEKIAIFC